MKKEIIYTTSDEQIALLIKKGLKIENVEIAKYNLERYGYYNIINSYKQPFQIKSNEEKVYRPGTTFEQIFSLFIFDHSLRNSVMSAMLDLEEYLRAAVAEILASNFGVDDKKYLQFRNFRDRTPNQTRFSLNGILGTLRNNANSDKDPIKYYRENYGIVPPWILLKGTYFSTLINLIKCFKNPQKKQLIRKVFDIPDDAEITEPIISLFQTTLFVCLSYRNMAAHGGRIYNFSSSYINKTNISVEILEFFPKLSILDEREGIRQLILLLSLFKYRQPFDILNNAMTQSANTYLKKYPGDLNIFSDLLGIRFERKHMCWLNSKTKTFHTNPYCSGMKNAISIDYKEVDKTIWIPCKRCANKNIL